MDELNMTFTNLTVKNIYRRAIQIQRGRNQQRDQQRHSGDADHRRDFAGGAAIALFGGNAPPQRRRSRVYNNLTADTRRHRHHLQLRRDS